MPAKRKTDVGGGDAEAATKKAKKDANMKLFEKMKIEAAENKRKAAERDRKTELQQKTTSSRRTTIAATSSSRPVKSVERPPRRSVAGTRKSLSTMKPNSRSRGVFASASVSSGNSEDDDDEEDADSMDEFDRLVHLSSGNSRPNSGNSNIGPQESSNQNEYAKVYTRQSSRPPSKRQSDFLKRKSQRGYHSSDDSEGNSNASEQESEPEAEVIEKKTKRKAKDASVDKEGVASSTSTSSAGSTSTVPGGKDDFMLQIDTILYSIVSFSLGVLLVVGLYITLTSLDATSIITSLFGNTFTGIGDRFNATLKRVVLLTIALTLTFGVIEIFMWFNERANRKVSK